MVAPQEACDGAPRVVPAAPPDLAAEPELVRAVVPGRRVFLHFEGVRRGVHFRRNVAVVAVHEERALGRGDAIRIVRAAAPDAQRRLARLFCVRGRRVVARRVDEP